MHQPDLNTDGTAGGDGRRSFLKKAGLGAAVAWTAPTISTMLTPAAAATAAITLVGTDTVRTNAATGALTVPGGVANGDYVVVVGAYRNSGSLTPPSGWTEQQNIAAGSSFRAYVWTAVHSGALSYTFSRGAINTNWSLVATWYSGVTGINTSTGAGSASSTTFTAPALTTSGNNEMVLAMMATRDLPGTVTNPGSYTTQATQTATPYDRTTDRLYPTLGTDTGAQSFTTTSASDGAAFLLALQN